MSWNYRVARIDYSEGDHDGRAKLGIFEAYYDDEGRYMGTTGSPDVWCWLDEGLDGLRGTLEMMAKALDKPVLDEIGREIVWGSDE